MIVVDTNILVYYFIKGDDTAVAAELFASDSVWIAPFLWRSEFLNTVLLYRQKELMPLNDILLIVDSAVQLMDGREFRVSPHKVLELATRSTCTAYDCEFVSLAKEVDVPLVTADQQILRAFPETAVSPQRFIT